MLGKVPPFAVGYSLDDVVFAWTGHGVNTDRDMKLSQFDLIRTPTGNGTKNQNKSEFIGYSFYIKSVSRLQPRSSPFIFGGGLFPRPGLGCVNAASGRRHTRDSRNLRHLICASLRAGGRRSIYGLSICPPGRPRPFLSSSTVSTFPVVLSIHPPTNLP